MHSEFQKGPSGQWGKEAGTRSRKLGRLQDLTEKPSVGSLQGGVDTIQTKEDDEKNKKFTNGGVIYSNSRVTCLQNKEKKRGKEAEDTKSMKSVFLPIHIYEEV